MSTEITLKHSLNTHPLTRGTAVTVLRLGITTKPFVEGRAVIQAVGIEPSQYVVVFENDPVPKLRHVYAACQDPLLLDALLNLWRSEPFVGLDDSVANDNTAFGRAK